MAEKIQLFYFHGARGRAECICMVLAAAGVEFEDVRIKIEDWRNDPKVKEATPYGQLPYVIYNGKKIGQSTPIATYFAKKYGFYGKNDEDALREEEVLHLALDFRFPHFRDWVFTPDTAKPEVEQKMKEDLFPRYLRYFQKLLEDNGSNGYFVGDSVTLADMYVYDLLETTLGIDPHALADFPLVQKLHSNVKAFPALKDYFANRRQTPI